MRPEAARFLKRAHICIDRAETMLTVSLNDDAGRTAYLACFHAAQALIFNETTKTSKTHNGVQTEFFRLTKDPTLFDPALRRFLSKSYELKAAADYFTHDDVSISASQAAEAVTIAKRFVAHLAKTLGADT